MLLEQNHNFNEEIKGPVVVVDFFATWCGPCKMLTPILEKFASDHKEVKVIKVDVDDFTNIAREYGVTSIPTLVLFNDGVMIDKKVGFMDYNSLVKWIIK